MDARELKYFVTLVEQRSFTKAAEHLHISQPSLSNAIKKLEKEIGLKLIDRDTRNFQLTREGDFFYQEAKKLIRHHEHINKEVKKMKHTGPAELEIGLIESSMLWLPEIVIALKEQYKEVRIKLLEILSLEEVEKALLNFDIHLAITNQPLNREEIHVIPIYMEKLVALLPPTHSLASQPFIHLAELAEDHLIVCKEGFQSREDILNAFRQLGIKPNIQFEIERFETATHLIEKNLGITLVPENYVKYAKTVNVVKSIKDISVERTVYLAYVKNRFIPEIVWKFIDLVKEFFGE